MIKLPSYVRNEVFHGKVKEPFEPNRLCTQEGHNLLASVRPILSDVLSWLFFSPSRQIQVQQL